MLTSLPPFGCATPPAHADAREPAPAVGASAPATAATPPAPLPSRGDLERALDQGAPVPNVPEVLPALTGIARDATAPGARRVRALEAIGAIDAPATVATLQTVLDDAGADPLLRATAAIALGRRAGSSAVAEVSPLLTDAHPELRAAAARALGTIGGEAARDSLEDRLTTEEDPATREAIQQSLTLLQP